MNPKLERSATASAPSEHAARGWLRHGNQPGDFHNCARCGAKTRAGHPCRSPAMKNGRCRMHGGKSTGPRTEAGLERCRQAHRKTGRYSQVQMKYRKIVLEITRCVNIAGEIVRARTKEVSASDPVQRDLCRGVTTKLVEKGDHLLHRIWAWKPFLAFAPKQAQEMYDEYLSYCRPANHPRAPRSGSPVEGRDRAALLVDLICGSVEVMSNQAMFTSPPL